MSKIKNPERICPECSAQFTSTTGRQVFCTPKHKERFHARQMARGKSVLSLLQTWRWRNKEVPEDLASYAHTELCSLVAEWVRDDKASGRQPWRVVATKKEQGWRAVDLF